jgi:hypothetical protein
VSVPPFLLLPISTLRFPMTVGSAGPSADIATISLPSPAALTDTEGDRAPSARDYSQIDDVHTLPLAIGPKVWS